ncbi:MAG: cyclic beta 1-2 glucan synthetase, partial [Planctomycetes bacterium]|nr:cyclic beta 1-2 glucan synthetase [Planctomycetota bacterium]
MLRLALIENLRRVGAIIAAGRRERDRADAWADRLLELAEHKPAQLIVALADLSQSRDALTPAFVAELARRIQGRHQALTLVVNWIEQRLGESGQAIEGLIQAENQSQAADQVSVGNSIGSLRFLASTDWSEFVESHSVVDHALRGDPADVYSDMDFATRDHYRHVVERLAKRSARSEQEVAALSVGLAHKGVVHHGDVRERHVGHYLVDEGLAQLERSVGARTTLRRRLGGFMRRHTLAVYLGPIVLGTLAIAELVAWQVAEHGLGPVWTAVACVLAAIIGSQAVIAVVNIAVGMLVTPRQLPRLDFTAGVPSDHQTMVVVPCMLSSAYAIDALTDSLEVRYVANREPNIYFALITDFTDASSEHMPGDAALVAHARAAIEALNQKHAPGDRACIFFLFHRPRRWNARERMWMGHERKRGKLADFNRALRCEHEPGDAVEGFSEVVGDLGVLPRIKHVITLDADTQLPMDSANKLVGTLAHPLNRPAHHASGVVGRGHGLLQPRVGISLPSANRSWYARLFSGEPGIDPYTRAVSDVYEDLFGEGSFIGKGIYDVDAFTKAVEGRLPDDAVLSHDLLEGCHVRSGLVSDVLLYEDNPSRYLADAARRHRWIRGDWQIAGWLRGRPPGSPGGNALSWLSQWKILDNLRRTCLPIALVAWAAVLWSVAAPWTWWLLPAAALLTPLMLSVVTEGMSITKETPVSAHLERVVRSAAMQLSQAVVGIVFLAHEACYTLDATMRAWWRLLVTRRRLLEWKTSTDAEREAGTGLIAVTAAMAASPLVAIVGAMWLAWAQPDQLPIAATVLGAWLVAPAVAWWLSRPIGTSEHRFAAADVRYLRVHARKTWRFYETFVTAEHHFLAPDNFQEHPAPVVAPRTSPTNIGCSLLANLAACDFGYLPPRGVLDRTAATFDTLDQLERYRGHLFNWYDTRTCKPLLPQYVSTVDSGNLSGHLYTLQHGLIELPDRPLVSQADIDGVHDALIALGDHARSLARTDHATGRIKPEALEQLKRLERSIGGHRPSLPGSHVFLSTLRLSMREVVSAFIAAEDDEGAWWARAIESTCQQHEDEIAHFAPWCLLPESPGTAGGGAWGEAFEPIRSRLWGDPSGAPTPRQIARLGVEAGPALARLAHEATDAVARQWIGSLAQQVNVGAERSTEHIARAQRQAQRAQEFAEIDYTFLYDRARDLFSIGYNVSDHRLDGGCYDLLASEARLVSFIAVALGQVTQDHWFTLGRMLTASGGHPALLSWSGSMFEYLMPLLVMPDHPHTILHRTYQAVVARQIEFGRQHGVPWGVSESGYNATDSSLNYQYRAFGVPGLGLKRGLGDDLVIAPYASAMALMVAPEEACRNLQRLTAEGREGRYGWYEAIDYTPSRVPPGSRCVTVRSYMAHHQGMAFLALAYVLLGRPMQRRFLADPLFRAADLLLHEKVPKASAPFFPHAAESDAPRRGSLTAEGTMRVFTSASTPVPEVHLLSNGRYHVMVSAAGGGSSRWRDLAVTRWREDATRDAYGLFCYLRDRDSDEVWSTSHQPTMRATKRYEAVFTQARAEFKRTDHDIDAHTEIAVSPEDDVEVRRVTLTNGSGQTRLLEATTYGETVLATLASDVAHPAFSNLFVRTELVPERSAILSTRRARSATEKPPWMFHLVAVDGAEIGHASFETSRVRFIGRGRTINDPAAMDPGAELSGTAGSVLDPVVAVRRTVRLAPEGTARIDIVTGMAETRDAALALIEKYHERRLTDRVFELAWTHSQVVLRQLGASETLAQVYGRLAGSVVYPVTARRAPGSIIARNRRGQSGLWAYGISGDLPIVLLRMSDHAKMELVVQVVQAHAYWRMKGLTCDLVIINEDHSLYRQSLHEQILAQVRSGPEASLIDKPGGIFVRRNEQLSEEDRVLLAAVARVVISDAGGSLTDHVERRGRPDANAPRLPARARRAPASQRMVLAKRDLVFDNGYGGFTRDGREYVISLPAGRNTPTPWVNVLANPRFGSVVSESGSAYSWAENCHEMRVSTWNNDPVGDTCGEAFYLRDDETGEFWSPTPAPARGQTPYVTRHGFGYSVFEHSESGIESELWTYVASASPVKYVVVRVRNRSGRQRRISVTGYCELVLGDLRHKHAPHIITEVDAQSGALFARNPFNTEFPDRVAFLDVSEAGRSVTGDRLEFLGRNGRLTSPLALGAVRLSGRTGAGYDPCAAMMTAVDLADGQEREVVFLIGAARDTPEARDLVGRLRGSVPARHELEQVWAHWNHTLGAVHLETPDAAINMLANGWLLYQTLSSRYWGRSGFYQSGGAYGFRDQLQDSLAFLHTEPALVRSHLLLAAAHQFKEGDVQHWWHPPQGRGVRTHFSDDFLWLPYATARYVAALADTGVLDEPVPFLEGRQVGEGEESYYDLPARSGESATLYEHCVRAITRSLERLGAHGIPLMGCGDWNDGMNLVGIHGKGESVWLAFFLADILAAFRPLAEHRGDHAFAERMAAAAAVLSASIEEHAWDGEWYRR